MKRIIRDNPLLILGLIGVALNIVVICSHIAYDEHGFRVWLFWLSQLFGLVIWIPSEIIFSMTQGKGIPLQVLIAGILGLIGCAGIDFVWRKFLGWISKKRRK
jgi:hypothetical protein